MQRFKPLRVVRDDEVAKRTEGLGACKYCIHARKVNFGKIPDVICTVFYRKYVEDIRKRKTDITGRVYLPDCREFREIPFSRPARGFFGTLKQALGKLLYPFVMWLKK